MSKERRVNILQRCVKVSLFDDININKTFNLSSFLSILVTS